MKLILYRYIFSGLRDNKIIQFYKKLYKEYNINSDDIDTVCSDFLQNHLGEVEKRDIAGEICGLKHNREILKNMLPKDKEYKLDIIDCYYYSNK